MSFKPKFSVCFATKQSHVCDLCPDKNRPMHFCLEASVPNIFLVGALEKNMSQIIQAHFSISLTPPNTLGFLTINGYQWLFIDPLWRDKFHPREVTKSDPMALTATRKFSYCSLVDILIWVIYIYMCMYNYVYIYVCIYICMYINIDMYIYIKYIMYIYYIILQ